MNSPIIFNTVAANDVPRVLVAWGKNGRVEVRQFTKYGHALMALNNAKLQGYAYTERGQVVVGRAFELELV